jgi:hypothetical protein
VTTAQARATVERAPYRLTIERLDGTSVLRNVENPRSPEGFGAGVDDEPGGSDALPNGGTRAEPLTFEIGGQTPVQYPGSPWQGNLLLSPGPAGCTPHAT